MPAPYHHEHLFEFACRVLERLNVPPEAAQDVAGCLVKADLRGVDSHGLVRLPVYTRRLAAGVVNARPNIQLHSAASSAALVDGDNGLGPVVASYAMDAALELAREHGIGYVGVRGSNHFGAAAYYVERAVSQGFIATVISNAPPNMAPYGGRVRFLGTNPLAVGVPAGAEDPLIFDASTSTVARGKIIVAAQEGQVIPDGWALDPDGYPTTDATQALAGAMLPFGGPKGSAISFLIDVFCGVMTGAAYAGHLNTLEDLTSVQNVGHVVTAIRPDLFLAENVFRERMDEILRMLKRSAPAPGNERVLVPGEIEMANERRHRRDGVPLRDSVAAQLDALGRELAVPFPVPRSPIASAESMQP
jgi:LDH2 family malate/lactate/ureidoglycolate dehydrogenase